MKEKQTADEAKFWYVCKLLFIVFGIISRDHCVGSTKMPQGDFCFMRRTPRHSG